VGRVIERGSNVNRFAVGDRVGVPWLGRTCGVCICCLSGRENLCDRAAFTGYTVDGGYAEYASADQHFCFDLPTQYSDTDAAPLLCAGPIGYRSLKMAGEASRVGIFGFGAAAHIIIQVARHQGRQVYAFTRPGDLEGQQFALELSAEWAGESTTSPPMPLDAAILFAPVGTLIPLALQAVVKGGTVVCAGVHMSDIPCFPYHFLWGERILRSVANLTRADGEEFLSLAPKIPIKTEVQVFSLANANDALDNLSLGRIRGAAVLVPIGLK